MLFAFFLGNAIVHVDISFSKRVLKTYLALSLDKALHAALSLTPVYVK